MITKYKLNEKYSFDLKSGITLLCSGSIDFYEKLLFDCPFNVGTDNYYCENRKGNYNFTFFLISLNPENHYIYETNKMCKLRNIKYLKENNLCLLGLINDADKAFGHSNIYGDLTQQYEIKGNIISLYENIRFQP